MEFYFIRVRKGGYKEVLVFFLEGKANNIYTIANTSAQLGDRNIVDYGESISRVKGRLQAKEYILVQKLNIIETFAVLMNARRNTVMKAGIKKLRQLKDGGEINIEKPY